MNKNILKQIKKEPVKDIILDNNGFSIITEKHKINILVYAIANISPEENNRIMETCRATNARLIIIPDLVKVLEKSIRKIEVQE